MSERYTITKGSDSGHCCFEATILDNERDENICECFELKDAELIAETLNDISDKKWLGALKWLDLYSFGDFSQIEKDVGIGFFAYIEDGDLYVSTGGVTWDKIEELPVWTGAKFTKGVIVDLKTGKELTPISNSAKWTGVKYKDGHYVDCKTGEVLTPEYNADRMNKKPQ